MQKWKKRFVIIGLGISLAAGGAYGCGDTENQEQTENNTEEMQEQTADNTEENQETAEETAGIGDTSQEKTELTQAEHPQFVADGIRRVVLQEEGQEIFNLSNEPAEYKMDFDYWEILNPYDETATVNTEIMYELFDVLCGLNFQAPVAVDAEIDTGIEDSQTSITLDFVNTLDDTEAKQTDYADRTATIILGNEDGAGNRFAAVQGYEDQIYKLSASTIDSIFSLEPFSYILKIPVLVNIDTVKGLEIQADNKTYEMNVDSVNGEYKFGEKDIEKADFTALYQEIFGIALEAEAEEEKINEEMEPELEILISRNHESYPEIQITYYTYDDTYDLLEVNGNRYFLVKAEDVDNLVKAVKKAF